MGEEIELVCGDFYIRDIWYCVVMNMVYKMGIM